MTLKVNSENQRQKSTLKTTLETDIANQHWKQHRKSTSKINIKENHPKKTRYIHVACRYHRPGCFAPNISVTFPPFVVSHCPTENARGLPQINITPGSPNENSVEQCRHNFVFVLSLNKSLVRDATKNEPFVEDPSKENVRQKNAASNTTPQRWQRNGSKRDRGAKAYG